MIVTRQSLKLQAIDYCLHWKLVLATRKEVEKKKEYVFPRIVFSKIRHLKKVRIEEKKTCVESSVKKPRYGRLDPF